MEPVGSTVEPPGTAPAAAIPVDGRSAGWAGAVAAGRSLGLTEFLAAVLPGVPSAVAAVGSVVVDVTPGWLSHLVIRLFGTADTAVLAVGTVLVCLGVGALVGRVGRRRPAVITGGFAGFAVLGIAASLAQPDVSPVATVLAVGVAALAGAGVLRHLLRLLDGGAAVTSPTEVTVPDPSRRRFVTRTAGFGVAAVAAAALGRGLTIRSSETAITTPLPLPDTTVPAPGPGTSFSVEGISPLVTPNDSFYRIDTALVVPRPDPATWTLQVGGMVDTPVTLTLDDLLAMPLHERYVTIACVSNEVGGNLIGNARWTGVRLVEVLDRAGVAPDATQIVGRSVDGWTAGFPTSAAYDGRDPLIAVGMNGEPLPRRHGYPARLIVPGLYGYVSATKWLAEIELTTWEAYDAYWVPLGWSKAGPIKTQSRIDTPGDGQIVNGGAPVTVAGVAWAPTRGIARVEVRIAPEDGSLDEAPWRDAEISVPLADTTWVQWRLEEALEPGTHYLVQVRATDGEGQTQAAAEAPPAPDGATGHHTIAFATS